ncbi:MAG: hypothetical protein ACI31S_03320 [Bacilli bacterium]
MKIDIDLKRIAEEIKLLNKHIDEYKKNDINYINVMGKIEDQLSGDIAIYFSEVLINEKKNNELIINSLEAIKNFYLKVYNTYKDGKYKYFDSTIVNNINYNELNKKSIINSLNNSVETLDDIAKNLQYIDLPDSFSKEELYNLLHSSIIKNKDDTINYKEEFLKCINNINKDENDLFFEISKIEEINVSKF